MTYDFSSFKVPVFTGINNQPVAPTAIKAGNGAHLIDLFNQFVDEMELVINSLDSSVNSNIEQPWTVLDSSNNYYQVQASDKFILFNPDSSYSTSITLSFPDNPQPQTTFSYLAINSFEISFNNFFRHSGNDANVMNYTSTPDIIKFIYVDENIGWISNRGDVIIGVYYN